ncbi:MAG: SRPBCC domain-containing protein [Flavobacteriales bacterium]
MEQKKRNYSQTFTVRRTPQHVYEAICRVPQWWTIHTDGATEARGDEFSVQFGDVHYTMQRITEAVVGERIVWRVTESRLPWLKDPEEWKGTEMVFDMAAEGDGTRFTFTHIGLIPQVECYLQCEKGWDYFIGTSLFKLITEGTGIPDTTERTHMDSIGHVRATNT